MVAAGMIPDNGKEMMTQPIVDPDYDWSANRQLCYTDESYDKALTWLVEMANRKPACFIHARLPYVTRNDLNCKQQFWFGMKAFKFGYQLFLIVNGPAGAGKLHNIARFLLLYLVSMLYVDLLRLKLHF